MSLDNLIVYSGCFDPIHMGHLKIIENTLKIFNNSILILFIDKFALTCKKNIYKYPKASLEYRINMCELAINKSNFAKFVKIKYVNFKKPYTINILNYFKSQYKSNLYSFIIGQDQKIDEWYKYKEIIKNYKILVYKRGQNLNQYADKNINYIDIEIPNISSTEIRDMIYNDSKSYTRHISNSVAKFIKEKKLYSENK